MLVLYKKVEVTTKTNKPDYFLHPKNPKTIMVNRRR